MTQISEKVLHNTLMINESNFDDVLQIIMNPAFSSSIASFFLSSYSIIKATINTLTVLSDIDNDNHDKSSIKLLKVASDVLLNSSIKNIIEDLKSNESDILQNDGSQRIKAEILTKWWGVYLSILSETYLLKKSIWGDDKSIWFHSLDNEFLLNSIKVLEQHYHWKIVLLQIMIKNHEFLSLRIDKTQAQEYYNIVWNYYSSRLEKEFNSFHNWDNDKTTLFRKDLIENLLKIFHQNSFHSSQNQDALFRASLLSNRFDKKSFSCLKHTVIIGDEGGFYCLLNTISEEEKEMIMEGGEISKKYANKWTKQQNDFKVIIGKGTFGKIRLSLVLIGSVDSRTLKGGQIICLKKTCHCNEKIMKKQKVQRIVSFSDALENMWSDYSSGEIGDFIYCPDVYDMKFIEPNSDIPEKHQKGYTMQQFMPLYNGDEVFVKQSDYSNDWNHQKSYLLSIFEVTAVLLDKGICMSDLKPANTLYFADIQQGVLIDLSGVVRKSNRAELEKCKAKYVLEDTAKFTAKELLQSKEEDVIDLCKCMAFTLGVCIKEICLKKVDHVYFDKLKALSDQMMDESVSKRLSIEEGIKIMRKIGPDEQMQTIDFTDFVACLLKEIQNNYEKFDLNGRISIIEEQYIRLMVSPYDYEELKNPKSQDLETVLDNFISGQIQNKEQVFVLLGSAGSGKSTILQRKYIESLKKWKKGMPLPFFMNLTLEEDLRNQWKKLDSQINSKIPFSVFQGKFKYPLVLFLDSFDEVPIKINYVSKFSKQLQNNPQNKYIICCRKEFIQKKHLFQLYFQDKCINFQKSFILPLNIINFNMKAYLRGHFLKVGFKIENESSLSDVLSLVKPIVNNPFLVSLTLDVLPDLISQKELIITKRILYEKYTRKKIVMTYPTSDQFIEKYKLKNLEEFIRFHESLAEKLAIFMHKMEGGGTNLILTDPNSKEKQDFLKLLYYNNNLSCFENAFLVILIRSLDLKVTIHFTIPREEIIVAFAHSSIGLYYLCNAIMKETEIMDNYNIDETPPTKNMNVLGFRLFIEDLTLMKFLVEYVQESLLFKKRLRNTIYNSRIFPGMNPVIMKSSQIAASNAISILVAANVSFSEENLNGIRIPHADLRDGCFNGCDFSYADLSYVLIDYCHLDYAVFNETKLRGVKLELGSYSEILSKEGINRIRISSDDEVILASCDDSLQIYEKQKLVKIYGRGFLSAISRDHSFLLNQLKNEVVLSKVCDGEVIGRYKKQGVCYLRFSFDDSKILICYGNNLMVYETKTGNFLREIELPFSKVSACAVSNDLKDAYLISSNELSSIYFLSFQTGKLERNYDFSKYEMNAHYLEISPDNSKVLIYSFESYFYLFEKKKVSIIKIKIDNQLSQACFSPDGSLVSTFDCKGVLKLWYTGNGKLFKNIQNNQISNESKYYYPENFVAFSNSGSLIACLYSKEYLRVYDLKKETLIMEYIIDGIWMDCYLARVFLSFSSDDTVLCVPNTFFYNLLTKEKTFKFHERKNRIESVSFASEKSLCYVTYQDCVLNVNLKNGNIVDCFKFISERIISFSSDYSLFLSNYNGDIHVWDMVSKTLLKKIEMKFSELSLNFSFDSSLILACSENKNYVFEIQSGKIMQEIKCEKWKKDEKSGCIVFNKDLSRFATGGDHLRLWDFISGSLISQYDDEVDILAITPDDSLIIIYSSSSSQKIQMLDGITLRLLKSFEETSCYVSYLHFFYRNECFLSGGREGFKIWNYTREFSSAKQYSGHQNHVLSLSLTSDDTKLVTSSEDQTIKIFDVKSGMLLKQLEGHTGAVNSVEFSHDGFYIISGSEDLSLKKWDVRRGELMHNYQRISEKDEIYFINISEDSSFILLKGSKRVTIMEDVPWTWIYNYKNGQPIRNLSGFASEFSKINSEVFFHSDLNQEHDNHLINVLNEEPKDFRIRKIDLLTGNTLQTYEGHTSNIFGLKVSSKDEYLASCSEDNTIKLWDIKNGVLLLSIDGHFYVVDFSPKNEMLLSFSEDSSIVVFDVLNGKSILTVKEEEEVTCAIFSHNGNFISNNSHSVINIRKCENADLISTFKGHTETIKFLSFSKDDERLFSSSEDETFKIWDVKNGSILKSFEGKVFGLSPDNNLLVIQKESFFFYFDLPKNQKIREFNGPEREVKKVAFSQNDTQILSISDYNSASKTIELWNSKTGEFLQSFLGHDAVFSNDGLFIYFLEGKTIKIWKCEGGVFLKTLNSYEEKLEKIESSPSPDPLILCSVELDKLHRKILIIDAKNGQILRTTNKVGLLHSMSFCKDSSKFLCAGPIQVWDTKTAQSVSYIETSSIIHCAKFCGLDSEQIFCGHSNRTVQLWAMKDSFLNSLWYRILNLVPKESLSSDLQMIFRNNEKIAICKMILSDRPIEFPKQHILLINPKELSKETESLFIMKGSIKIRNEMLDEHQLKECLVLSARKCVNDEKELEESKKNNEFQSIQSYVSLGDVFSENSPNFNCSPYLFNPKKPEENSSQMRRNNQKETMQEDQQTIQRKKKKYSSPTKSKYQEELMFENELEIPKKIKDKNSRACVLV